VSEDLRDPNKAVDHILKEAGKHAEAKAERIYLEEFRKSKKALLMNECTEKAAVSREQFAYSHPDYIALLEGLKEAIKVEETLKWQLIGAQARIEIWRTQSANNRNQDRTMR
jgi:hypothetical protein